MLVAEVLGDSRSAALDVGEIIIFRLEQRRFGLPLSAVQRVLRMVEITPLPGAPAVVLGVIDVGGSILPVCDPRQRFGLATRTPRASDNLIIARTARRSLGLAVERVEGLMSIPPERFQAAEGIVPQLPHVAGVVNLPGQDLVVIENLDRFLSLDEEAVLDAALLDHAG